LDAAPYAGATLITIPAVVLVPQLLGLGRSSRLFCACVMVATISLIDGIVVRWFGWIYATEPAARSDAAASLLFAIGMLVTLGLVMSRPGRSDA
jgi:hypothetical protein